MAIIDLLPHFFHRSAIVIVTATLPQGMLAETAILDH